MAECHGFVPYMQLCVCYDKMGCPEQAFFFIRKRWNRSRKIREYYMTRNISGKNMVWHKRKDIFIIFSWQNTGLRGSYAQAKAVVIYCRKVIFL